MPALTTTPQEELHIPQITLGVRLRLARESVGLDQQELADLLGIAQRSIGNYEREVTRPKRPVLLSWALATGVPLGWLTEGDIETHIECPNCHTEVHAGMTCFLCSTQVSGADPQPLPEPPSHPQHGNPPRHLQLV